MTKFAEIFQALKEILMLYEAHMDVKANTDDNYYLDTFKVHPIYNKIAFFGAVRIKKNYVSIYLMPVYDCPDLLKDISPELKKRMQGKSCFNFKEYNPEVFNELKKLTECGYNKYVELNLV